MKTLTIENGVIANISEGEAEFSPPQEVEYRVVPSDLIVDIGWLANGDGSYTDLSPSVPPDLDPWDDFDDRLVIQGLSNPDSPYRQLTAWAKSVDGNYFLDAKNNIAEAIRRKSVDVLQFAMADLKAGLSSAQQFTELQITEINACLAILGVVWRWEDL